MYLTDGLARQCAVILPAIGIALTVQIRGIQRDLKSRVDKVVELNDVAFTNGVKYARYSPEGILIDNTVTAFRWWDIIGSLVNIYAVLVLISEGFILSWLAGVKMNSFFGGGAEFLVVVTLIGLVAVFLIPAARFWGETSVISPQRLKLAKECIED
ncbi:hypothetical protein ACFZAG_02845 [Streptomyces sp. NPDC012403]|uniref:hypothetical protein n=1 Tax=Streptomyces sp. NPDC012403 TaxID=3364831 RepID=UPI0036E54780